MHRRFASETLYCGPCVSYTIHTVRDRGPFTAKIYRCTTCSKRTTSDERHGARPMERGDAQRFRRYLERRTVA